MHYGSRYAKHHKSTFSEQTWWSGKSQVNWLLWLGIVLNSAAERTLAGNGDHHHRLFICTRLCSFHSCSSLFLYPALSFQPLLTIPIFCVVYCDCLSFQSLCFPTRPYFDCNHHFLDGYPFSRLESDAHSSELFLYLEPLLAFYHTLLGNQSISTE